MRYFGIPLSVVLVTSIALQGRQPQKPASVDSHLQGWEEAMKGSKSIAFQFDLSRTDPVFKREAKYTGAVACMKPNLFRFSIGSTSNKNDYTAYICNGKSTFEYEWSRKTVTEIPIAPGDSDSLMFDLLGGMTAAAAKKRFQIASLKPDDEHYVYLDIKPSLPKDKQEFESLRMALFAPKVAAPLVPYLPAQIVLQKPNGDTEKWTFREHVLNSKEVTPADFEYQEPKEGSDWKKLKRNGLNPFGALPPPKGSGGKP